MAAMRRKKPKTTSASLIAPCGMNCRLCLGYIREENTCPGCRMIDSREGHKSGSRNKCRIRNCEQIAEGNVKYCSGQCDSFPCTRLRQLDKRYRTKYGMSMIDNLKMIDESGIRRFVRNEDEKWTCPSCGEIICVHRPVCLHCGHKRG